MSPEMCVCEEADAVRPAEGNKYMVDYSIYTEGFTLPIPPDRSRFQYH